MELHQHHIWQTRCLQKIAQAIVDSKPDAARAIEDDFYMDDLISGADDATHAIQLQRDIVESLAEYGLPLYVSSRVIRKNCWSVCIHR